MRVRLLTSAGLQELRRCFASGPCIEWRELDCSDGRVYGEVSDGEHLLEVELEAGRAVVRYSICHLASIDGFFILFVLSVARCARGRLFLDEDPVGSDEPADFEEPFGGFESVYRNVAESKRQQWEANFGRRRNGLRCGEALQLFVR